MHKALRPAFLALVVALSLAAGNASADARDVVARYHDGLLGALDANAQADDKARFDAMKPTMDAAFDFAAMIKTAAGRYWRGADKATQDALQDAFRRVSIATHADQFAGLTDGSFDIKEVRDGPRGLKLVDSVLTAGGDKHDMTYVVRDAGGTWKIIDVLLDGGISELALRSSEYAAILKDGGAKALVQTLNSQADTLLKE